MPEHARGVRPTACLSVYVLVIFVLLPCAATGKPEASVQRLNLPVSTEAPRSLTAIDVAVERDRYVISGVGDAAVESGLRVGDVLVAAGAEEVVATSFAEAVQQRGTFIMPLVDATRAARGKPAQLGGFLRVQYFAPESLTVERAHDGGEPEVPEGALTDGEVAVAHARRVAAEAKQAGTEARALVAAQGIELEDEDDGKSKKRRQREAYHSEESSGASSSSPQRPTPPDRPPPPQPATPAAERVGGAAGGPSSHDLGGGFYEAVFPDAGPMGFELDERPGVLGIAQGTQASRIPALLIGDLLVSVNGKDVPVDGGMRAALKMLREAPLPRVLKFKRGGGATPGATAQEFARRADELERGVPRTADSAARPHVKRKNPQHPRMQGERAEPVLPSAMLDGLPPPEPLEPGEYDVIFTEKGPMGFQIDANSASLVVTDVEAGGMAAATGKIVPGDTLVGINEVRLSGMEFSEAVGHIGSADWPRRLRFLSAKAVAAAAPDDDGEDLSVRGFVELTWPQALAGLAAPAELAEFGDKKFFGCDVDMPVAVANPVAGCAQQLDIDEPGGAEGGGDEFKAMTLAREANTGPPDAPAVMSVRGTCPFPDKVFNVQNTGASAVVVVNKDDDTFRMPGGSLPSAEKVSVPAMTLPKSFGMLLMEIARQTVPRARFISAIDECAGDGETVESFAYLPLPPEEGATQLMLQHGGVMFLWSNLGEAQVGFVLAMFGPEPNAHIAAPLVDAKPFSACVSEGSVGLENSGQLKGNYAVVERGACPFFEKVRNAQAAGAIGVIIINSEPEDAKLMMVPAPAEELKTFKVPAVMVTSRYKETEILQRRSHHPVFARLVLHDEAVGAERKM